MSHLPVDRDKNYMREMWGTTRLITDYVKTPENCGDIVFYSPRSEECLTIPTRDGNYSNYMYCTYKAVQSNVIIFRSNVPHMVKQNNSKENRCSIAMNFNYN